MTRGKKNFFSQHLGLASRRESLSAIWPKRASTSKLFIANYRGRVALCVQMSNKAGMQSIIARCATIIKSLRRWRRRELAARARREMRRKHCPRRLSVNLSHDHGALRENLYSTPTRRNDGTDASLAERGIYRRLKPYEAIHSRGYKLGERIIKQTLLRSVVAA